ncbi:MAG: ornithine cyclodeaminase family protein [Ekhidna sp.]
MKNKPTIILTGSQVSDLLPLEECIGAVENAFKLYAQGKITPPGILGIHVAEGGYHIKAGVIDHFVAKANANFPLNPKQYELPTIQGVVTVYDKNNGQLLALMDSIQVTIIRTGAATAVAAKYLSREDAQTVSIIGCGAQGRISVKMLQKVRPKLRTVYAFDTDEKATSDFSKELENQGLEIKIVDDFREGLSDSDICVTCTTVRKPFLAEKDLPEGIFVAAVGSDSEEKNELFPEVLSSNKVVTDVTDQCESIGELNHAIEAGQMKSKDVHAELGEIICGKKKGRLSSDEIIIFDSTGTGLQDVAAASIIYAKAEKDKVGHQVFFNS